MTPEPHGYGLLPGLVHTGLFTALAFFLAHFVGPFGVEAAALGVVLGVLAGNLYSPETTLGPGVRFAGKRVLAFAVVLLGLRVSVQDVLGLGGRTALLVLGVVVTALLLAFLIGRLFGVPRPMAALIGAGTAVCGASAIAAVRNTVGAEEKDVSYAVAAITALGSIGLLVYPAVQLAFHPLDATGFGQWSGATLHAVPQAIGAAFAGGGIAAGAPATVVKLSRVALLGPVAIALAFAFKRRGEKAAGTWLPVEVWGFLLLFILGSILPLPAGLLDVVGTIDRIALVYALTALGLQTRFGDIRQAGTAPLGVAVLTWLLVAGGVFLMLRVAPS
ncbi:MAG: putative sulfate exporter family transporter [Euryarchaeota archaeon]|nr:putative sulfate exporter family transporter [Euryarchaeota archaeon]